MVNLLFALPDVMLVMRTVKDRSLAVLLRMDSSFFRELFIDVTQIALHAAINLIQHPILFHNVSAATMDTLFMLVSAQLVLEVLPLHVLKQTQPTPSHAKAAIQQKVESVKLALIIAENVTTEVLAVVMILDAKLDSFKFMVAIFALTVSLAALFVIIPIPTNAFLVVIINTPVLMVQLVTVALITAKHALVLQLAQTAMLAI